MGNGCLKGGGVRGTAWAGASFCMGVGAGSMIVGTEFGTEGRGREEDEDEPSVGFGSLSGM